MLVPPNDVTALAAALDRLLGDAALRARLGQAARSVGSRLRPAEIIGRWDQILEELAVV